MQSVTFSDESCHSMSDYAVSHFFTDRYADPVAAEAVPTHIQHQISVGVRFSGAVAPFKIFVLFQGFHLNSIRIYSITVSKRKSHISAA